MVNDFVFFQPVKIIFGMNRVSDLDNVLDSLGAERCMLVCDAFFAEKGRKLMQDNSRIVGVFSDVEPNPQLSGAAEVARMCRELGADSVIGLGGGSSIDTAKFDAAIAPL